MSVRWQGFAVGFLGLAGLDVLVGSKNAAGALGGLAGGAGNLARKILSPAVPAFSSTPKSSAPSTVAPSNPPGVTQGGNQPGGVGPPTTVPPNTAQQRPQVN